MSEAAPVVVASIDAHAEAEARRLGWQCRRGLLELELWLQAFMTRGFAELDDAQRRRFGYLLRQDDMTLYDWLSGQRPAPEAYSDLVTLIRAIHHDATYRHPHP